jgi:hypothetical protein
MNIPPAATLKICSDSAVNLFDSFYKKDFYLTGIFYPSGWTIIPYRLRCGGSFGGFSRFGSSPRLMDHFHGAAAILPPHIPDKFKRI